MKLHENGWKKWMKVDEKQMKVDEKIDESGWKKWMKGDGKLDEGGCKNRRQWMKRADEKGKNQNTYHSKFLLHYYSAYDRGSKLS